MGGCCCYWWTTPCISQYCCYRWSVCACYCWIWDGGGKGLPKENTLHGNPCPQARSIYCAVCPLSVDQARGALTPTMETPLANDWWGCLPLSAIDLHRGAVDAIIMWWHGPAWSWMALDGPIWPRLASDGPILTPDFFLFGGKSISIPPFPRFWVSSRKLVGWSPVPRQGMRNWQSSTRPGSLIEPEMVAYLQQDMNNWDTKI